MRLDLEPPEKHRRRVGGGPLCGEHTVTVKVNGATVRVVWRRVRVNDGTVRVTGGAVGVSGSAAHRTVIPFT